MKAYRRSTAVYSLVHQSNCTFIVQVVGAVYVWMFFCFVVTSNFPHFVYWPTFSGIITTMRFLCVTRLNCLKWLSAVKTSLGCSKLFTQIHFLALRWHFFLKPACVRKFKFRWTFFISLWLYDWQPVKMLNRLNDKQSDFEIVLWSTVSYSWIQRSFRDTRHPLLSMCLSSYWWWKLANKHQG